jgi:hypothetical protein
MGGITKTQLPLLPPKYRPESNIKAGRRTRQSRLDPVQLRIECRVIVHIDLTVEPEPPGTLLKSTKQNQQDIDQGLLAVIRASETWRVIVPYDFQLLSAVPPRDAFGIASTP